MKATRSLAPLALLFGLSLTGGASAQSAPTPLGPAATQPAPVPRTAPPPSPAPTTASPTPTTTTLAPAAQRTVHVLGLDSDNADDQVEPLTQALRARVRATSSWQLGSVTTSLSMVTAALKCPQRPDAECTQRMGDEFKADRVMYGWINKSGAHEITAELHLWIRGQREIVATESYPDNVGDPKNPKLQAVADRFLEKLLGEKPPAPPPVKPPPPVIKEKVEEPKAVTESHGVSARTVLGWTAIGLGVGAGVFGAIEGARFLSLQSDNKDDADKPGAPRDFCSPDRTDACTRYEDAKSARLLTFIGAGAGVVLVGTGVVLLLTDRHRESPRTTAAAPRARAWDVAPRVGPKGGGVDFKLAF
ncbi:hypothetical protein [Pendulispora albinea]|uniref:Secreted protein n=1 Tax=Pendulispora albinea TaxID=2741071 RepID=A0ABZ2LX53_9BACT